MLFVWIGFIAFVLLMLALDLGVFHRKAHVVGVREALAWSAVWIALGLSFSRVRLLRLRGPVVGPRHDADAVDRSAELPTAGSTTAAAPSSST